MSKVAKKRPPVDSKILLSSIDIEKVISLYIALKQHDNLGNLVGLCPFHQENNASFEVFKSTQLYHCYGCGQGGDAISFMREYLHSRTPLIELAKLAVKKKWVTWGTIRVVKKETVFRSFEINSKSAE